MATNDKPTLRTDPLVIDRAQAAKFLMSCELYIRGVPIKPLMQMILYADIEDVEREAGKLLAGVDDTLIHAETKT